MTKKISSLIDMKIADFLTIIEEKEVLTVRTARLIPIYKAGDEMSLTSIFLSSLRLVKEFKKQIFSATNLSMAGKIYVFTEVNFSELKGEQPDGLIIVVSAGKIKDAALLEVKNKNSDLDEGQILRYLDVAKRFKIPKLITISNQFVSTPTQTPLHIKAPKNVALYHLSWSYIMTLAHILLFENDNNIEDEDQVEVMREVVKYFDHSVSGVNGFTIMKAGWKNVIDKMGSNSSLRKNDPDVIDTVSSWLQEERDMALILSRELGLLVKSGIPKFKTNLKGRIDYEVKCLLDNKALSSTLQIANAASNIGVTARFDRRQVQMEVILNPPEDKTNRGKIGWIRNQILSAQKRNPETFAKLEAELALYIYIKRQKEPSKVLISDLEDAWERFKDRDIKNFGIRQEKNLARNFESRKNIVKSIEDMLVDYYTGVVQYLKAWVKQAPKAQQKADSKSLDGLD